MVAFWSFVNSSIPVCPCAHRRGNAEYANRHIVYNLVAPAAGCLYLFENARFFKLICATSLGKICVSDHAMNAVDEMSALDRDLKRFFEEAGADDPVWQALEREAGKYLR